MQIIKERTRLIFTEFTPNEKIRIDDLVGTVDKVFSYEDPDGKMICLPTGMEAATKAAFPGIRIVDKSSEFWDYARITPVQHNAQPRNQLQKDFIQFVLENANAKKKLAGILSPGTGKAEPVSRKLLTPNGHIYMGDVKVGTTLVGSDGSPISVTGVFPQGVKDIYRINLSDRRYALCSAEHLWTVKYGPNQQTETISTVRLMRRHYNDYMIPTLDSDGVKRWHKIVSIQYSHQEHAQCIMVDAPDELYVTEQNVITHNTFMACYSALKVGLRTLIIVPTSGIKVQWVETLRDMFKVDPSHITMVNQPKDFFMYGLTLSS